MKTKTIKKVIHNKFTDWVNSLEDESLQKLVLDNSLISGGCIASMLLQEDPHDFDIYFTNKETVLRIAKYYASKSGGNVVDVDTLLEIPEGNPERDYFINRGFKEPGRVGIFDAHTQQPILEENQDETLIKEKYRIQYISPNAISLTDKIQLILRFYGTPEEIHSNYDYIHCTNYWLSKGEELVLNPKALEAILTKELIYIGSKYPIASILRTKKFLKRGFSISAGDYLKMIYQVSKLNLDDISVLEDQLVGVDVAYFTVLLDALRAGKETANKEGKEFTLNYGYIVTLVNKIFH